ncbi:MAG: class I SAM-dependent methyltransferase [Chitinophagaceae bacterium]
METKEAYDIWAKAFDTVANKARNLEATALRSVLSDLTSTRIVELGCGTGKNTVWLAEKCTQLTAVDFTPEMLEIKLFTRP